MAQLNTTNYPLARLVHRTGLDASGNVRHSAGLREFNVLDYGAVGNGSTNDYSGVAAAITALYANKGGRLVFPFTANGYVLGSSVVIDPTQYSGGGSIEIDLGGNHITQTHNGWMFDIRDNYFGANNGYLEAGYKRIHLAGNGAYLIGTSTALGCVRASDQVRSRFGGFTAKGYTVGVAMRLHVTDVAFDGQGTDSWCEMNTVYDVHSIGTKTCIHLMSGGGLDGTNPNNDRYSDWGSFLGNKFINCVHQGDVMNAVGFDIEGSGNESIWESCGGFVNQNGMTGGKLFHFNGTQPGTFIGPWSDVAGQSSPLHDVVFGPYANITNEWARPIFVGANNMALPHNWRDRITLLGPVRNGNGSGGINKAGDSPREVLSADRTWYVSPTGSDSNAGTNATDATGKGYGPFATIAKALQVIRDSIDAAGFNVTIQLADGTYTTPVTVNFTPTGLNGATFTLRGNTATPGNVILSTTSNNALTVTGGAKLTLEGVELRTTTSGTGLYVDLQSRVTIGTGNRFGACATRHVMVTNQSRVDVTAAYTITGNTADHWTVQYGSQLIHNTGSINAANRSFTGVFARCSDCSQIVSSAGFTTTSSTGTRYYVESGGLIRTYGAGASYFPGSVAGFAESGQFAQYL